MGGQTKNVNGELTLFAKRKIQTNIPTDIDVVNDDDKIIKFIRNNVLYIKKNGNIYNVLGRIVK